MGGAPTARRRRYRPSSWSPTLFHARDRSSHRERGRSSFKLKIWKSKKCRWLLIRRRLVYEFLCAQTWTHRIVILDTPVCGNLVERHAQPRRSLAPLIDLRLVLLPVYFADRNPCQSGSPILYHRIPLYTMHSTHRGTCIVALVDLPSHSLWATLSNKPSSTFPRKIWIF